MGAGRFKTKLDLPAGKVTASKPFEFGFAAVAAAPFTLIVPPDTQLGIRTKYVNADVAVTVVVNVSLNGYCVATLTVIAFVPSVVVVLKGPRYRWTRELPSGVTTKALLTNLGQPCG